MTAYSAISCASSSDQILRRIFFISDSLHQADGRISRSLMLCNSMRTWPSSAPMSCFFRIKGLRGGPDSTLKTPTHHTLRHLANATICCAPWLPGSDHSFSWKSTSKGDIDRSFALERACFLDQIPRIRRFPRYCYAFHGQVRRRIRINPFGLTPNELSWSTPQPDHQNKSPANPARLAKPLPAERRVGEPRFGFPISQTTFPTNHLSGSRQRLSRP
jgi:hypothetical protein